MSLSLLIPTMPRRVAYKVAIPFSCETHADKLLPEWSLAKELDLARFAFTRAYG